MIDPRIINLLKKYKIDEVENSLLDSFIQINNIKTTNKFLLNKIDGSLFKIVDYIKKIKNEFRIKELELLFEHLYSDEIKKMRGIIYTPDHIIKYIVNRVISSEGLVCDPSCGSGGFLLESTNRLHKISGKDYKEIIESYIYGCDISEKAIERTKIILSLLSELNNEPSDDIKFNIIKDNSLLLDWNNRFPAMKNNGGFDYVVGNPPYVKLQNMDDETRKVIPRKWSTVDKGTHNLYIPFIQLGSEIINNNGELGYIVSSMYFKSKASKKLREYLSYRRLIDTIIDFGDLQVFDNVQTYTCLTFINKTEKDHIKYAQITDLNNVDNVSYSNIFYNQLNSKKWRLLTNEEYYNINKIETSKYKLIDVSDINTGIATLKDKLYSVDSNSVKNGYYIKEYKGEKYKIEKNITRAFIKISDFSNETDLKDNKRRIIYPYQKNRPIIMKEDELINEYPNTYEYLSAIKKELSKRDKGKKKYATWYAYGRTQGLTNPGVKLLTPTFSNSPRFMLCEDENALFCNGYSIMKKRIRTKSLIGEEENISIHDLHKILNSIIMNYYINKTSYVIQGGYYCYQKQFISTFGVPEFSAKEIEKLRNLENKKEIDDFLIKKYGLNF